MKISTRKMIAEHKHLVRVLDSGSSSQRKKEAKKQKKELKNYKNKLHGKKK